MADTEYPINEPTFSRLYLPITLVAILFVLACNGGNTQESESQGIDKTTELQEDSKGLPEPVNDSARAMRSYPPPRPLPQKKRNRVSWSDIIMGNW